MDTAAAPLLGDLATPWTVLTQAAAADPRQREAAIERLTRLYWPSVYAYLRRDGLRVDHAEDVAQGFFSDAVLGRHLFQRAEPGRGKLRALILTALKNYRTDCARRTEVRRHAQNGFSADAVHEESLLVQDPAATADGEFARRLDLRIVEQALHRCERHFLAARRQRHWDLYEARVLAPARGHAPAPALEAIAPTLGFPSAAAAAAAVQTVRLRLNMFIRQIVREHSLNEEEASETLGRLLPKR